MSAYAKAIAAFVTPAIVSLLIPFGLDGNTTLESAINVLVLAGLTALSVYFIPNKK